MRTLLVGVALLVCSTLPVAAQSVTCSPTSAVSNPLGNVTFTVSADHNVMQPVTGVQLVTKYVGSIYKSGDSAVTAAVDYGKPTPNASNLAAVSAWPALTTFTKDTLYCYRLDTVGPGGTASAALIPFVYPATIRVPTTATGVTLQ